MYNFLILVGVAVVELLISYFFFDKIFERKRSAVVTASFGGILYLIGIFINIAFSSTLINTIFFAVINFLFSFVCFTSSLKKAAFYSLILDVLSTSLEFVTVLLVSVVFDKSVVSFKSEQLFMLIEGSLSKVLYFICVLIISRLTDKNQDNISFPKGFYVFPLANIFTLICFWYVCVSENLSNQTEYLLSAIILILFSSTILVFISYQHTEKREKRMYELETEVTRLYTEKNYYEILKKQNDDIRTYAHDAKNHLAAIKNLNKDPDIERYICQMNNSLTTYMNVSHSGNAAFDVMIDKYITECKLRNTRFTYDVRLSNLQMIEYFDLVTIIGNLMDNAVESAEKSELKWITLETDYRNSYEVLIITNSCDEKPAFNGEKLITTKKDKRLHGIGIKSVRKSLRKYAGDLSWEYDETNKSFSVTAMMYHSIS